MLATSGGFTALPITLNGTWHYLYARPDAEEENELFLTNIPVCSTLDDVKRAVPSLSSSITACDIAVQGVQSLLVRESYDGKFPNIRALFQTTSPTLSAAPLSFQITLSITAKSFIQKWPSDLPEWPAPPPRPIKDLYLLARPDIEDLRKHTDEWMAAFDAPAPVEAAPPKKRKAIAVEDEAWTVVERGTKSRNAASDGKTSKVGVIRKEKLKELAAGPEGQRKRKKPKVVDEGFYRDKKAEKRQSKQSNLAERFAQDQAKLAHLRKTSETL